MGEANAKTNKKDEEVNAHKQQVEEAKNATREAEEKAQKAEHDAHELKQKTGQQLARLQQDIAEVGRMVGGDPKDYEAEIDPNNPDETLAHLRVLLTKIKHHAQHGGMRGSKADDPEDKNKRESEYVQNSVMLNQSKEKIANLESDLKDAHEELAEMREKMDARNARIAQLAKEGGYGEDGLTDEDLDPDLQLLHDEHTKQLR